jgi:hypothetical protein
VLRVNREYIASAARADAARPEPPFRLQGSYRDLNAIARRIDPVMSDAEVDGVIDDHYRAQAQTLGNDAEANLLKLAVLRGRHSGEDRDRWEDVRTAYVRSRS